MLGISVSIRFHHVGLPANNLADALAKQGVERVILLFARTLYLFSDGSGILLPYLGPLLAFLNYSNRYHLS